MHYTQHLELLDQQENDLLASLQEIHRMRKSILCNLFALEGDPIQFEEDQHRLCWSGGQLRLGIKGFQFVKTLWDSKERRGRVTVNRLARVVWGDELADAHCIASLVTTLRRKFQAAKFPYSIASILNKRTGQRVGYMLRPVEPEELASIPEN